MKRLILILLIGTLFIMPPFAIAQTQTYHNATPSVMVNLPDGWKIAANNPGASHGSVVFTSPDGSLATIKWDKGYSLIQSEGQAENQLSSSGGMQTLNSSDVTLNGGQDSDRLVAYTLVPASGNIEYVMGVYGANGGFGYSIEIESTNHTTVSSAYEVIAGSFQFVGDGSGSDSSNISGLFLNIMKLILVMTGLVIVSMEAQRILERMGHRIKKKPKTKQ